MYELKYKNSLGLPYLQVLNIKFIFVFKLIYEFHNGVALNKDKRI